MHFDRARDVQDIHLRIPAPPLPIQQTEAHPLRPNRIPRSHPFDALFPERRPMQPGGQSLEPGRPGKMLLKGNGHEHTHRAMRLLLRHGYHLRRLPNRSSTEPQDQEAEQERSLYAV